MQLAISDFNGAAEAIDAQFASEWEEVQEVLTDMPLHIKASDQAGIQGTPIFDAVGTNGSIHQELTDRGWRDHLPIPAEYQFLGKDVDFGKGDVILEVQFSNYPFLLNNLMRSELFYKAGVDLDGIGVQLLVIVTKGKMWPASQSTLYSEQAEHQISALAEVGVVELPIRLVGLIEQVPSTVQSVWTTYHAARYSRTVVEKELPACQIDAGARATSRVRLTRV
jgi:hypothetical protein